MAEDSVRKVGLEHMLGMAEVGDLDGDEAALPVPPPAEVRGRAPLVDCCRDAPTLGRQHGQGFRQRGEDGGVVRGWRRGRGRGRGRGRARAGGHFLAIEAPPAQGPPPSAPEAVGPPPPAPEAEGPPLPTPEAKGAGSPAGSEHSVGFYFSNFIILGDMIPAFPDFASPAPPLPPQMVMTSGASDRTFAHSSVFEPVFDLSTEPSRGIVTQEGGDIAEHVPDAEAADHRGGKRQRASTKEEEEEQQPLRRSR